jgi:hypothetical protein
MGGHRQKRPGNVSGNDSPVVISLIGTSMSALALAIPAIEQRTGFVSFATLASVIATE